METTLERPDRKHRQRAALPEHLMYVDAVVAATGISLREVWRKSSSEKSFPKPRKLSARKTVWLRAEIEAWMEERGVTK